MKNLIKSALVFTLVLLFSGCASIANNSTENFNFNSDPTHANVTIKDVKLDRVVATNITPFSITLEKKHAFFSGKEYFINVSKKGYLDVNFSIQPSVSGWYLVGNLFFGGVLGWLIVDPATGAMWNLNPQGHDQININNQTIMIKLLSDLSYKEQEELLKTEPIIKPKQKVKPKVKKPIKKKSKVKAKSKPKPKPKVVKKAKKCSC